VDVCPDNVKFASGTVIITAIIIALTGWSAEAKTWRITNVKQSSAIHLRQLPSSKSKIIGYIPSNAKNLSGGTCRGSWCQIEYNGRKGWVYKKYLAAQKQEAYSNASATSPNKASPNTSKSLSFPAPPKGQDIPLKSSRDGPPIPVYAFPSKQLPISGNLPSATATVKSMGTCVRNWCYVRSGSLVGWIPQTYFASANEDSSKQAVTNSLPEQTTNTDASQENTPEQAAKVASPVLNNTEPTATQIAPQTAIPAEADYGATKLYSLAGLSSSLPLIIRKQPNDDGAVLGSVPHNAKDVEGLHKCIKKWCLVRYHKLIGWVLRRHLADDSLKGTKSYLVTGIGLMDKLEVIDMPANNGDIVGHIPAYATGIVPIGRCDDSWCHVRYLGVAGWVRSKYLTPSKRSL
jgi:SH3-like domain-containing protein